MGGKWRLFVILFALSLTSGQLVLAQEVADESDSEPESSEEKKDDSDKGQAGYRLLPIPIIITEPAIGEGLGVALALFHPVKQGKGNDTRALTIDTISEYSTPRQAPPVVTGVAGAYTNSKSWFGGVGHTNNWRNDSIRYSGLLAAAKVNSRIYVLNLPLEFSMESRFIYQGMKFRIKGSDFMAGFGISYLDAENSFGIGLPQVVDDERFSTDIRNVGIAGMLAYETRDNTMNPRSGRLVELNLWRYDDSFGGDYNYWSGKLKALSFHSLGQKVTLGLRLEASAVDGGVPFFAIPFVRLRGVPALRYQNKIAGAVEIEGRYLIRPRWEVSVFGGLGFTSDDYPIYENPDSIYNFGLGGRYNIFQQHNVWVGLDIARGPEDWNWYIQVGHAW